MYTEQDIHCVQISSIVASFNTNIVGHTEFLLYCVLFAKLCQKRHYKNKNVKPSKWSLLKLQYSLSYLLSAGLSV